MADETYTKADLDAAVAKATGDIDGLKSKIEELIGDNKKLKADLRKTQDIKPEDLASLESDNEKLRADLAAANKTAKDATVAAEKAAKALETESAFTQKLLKQDGLKTHLIENGVKDADFIDSLTAKFEREVTIVVDGESRKAMMGDKPLADAIKEWAGSDAGKKFVAAAVNGGGGAPGGGGSSGGKTATRAAFDAMPPGEKLSFAKEGGQVVDAA